MSAVDTLLELSRDRLKDQSDNLRLIMTKNSVMLGIAILVAREGIPQEASEAPGSASIMILCMYFCIVICVLCGLAVIFPRDFAEGLILDKAAGVLEDYELGVAKEWIAKVNLIACGHNARYLRCVERLLRWGLGFLVASLLFFALSRDIHQYLIAFPRG